MNIVYFFSSVNKLSLIAFLITLGFLLYEIILLKKERVLKTKPKIPKFKETLNSPIAQPNSLIVEKEIKVTKANNLIILILLVLLLIFGILSFFGFANYNKKELKTVISPTPVIDFITSKGIKIFNENFQPIADKDIDQIKPGEDIVIGVETINNTDINRARIRVNTTSWQNKDITTDFYPKDKIYYIKYKVASDESRLKIEAQLHSVADGWLSD